MSSVGPLLLISYLFFAIEMMYDVLRCILEPDDNARKSLVEVASHTLPWFIVSTLLVVALQIPGSKIGELEDRLRLLSQACLTNVQRTVIYAAYLGLLEGVAASAQAALTAFSIATGTPLLTGLWAKLEAVRSSLNAAQALLLAITRLSLAAYGVVVLVQCILDAIANVLGPLTAVSIALLPSKRLRPLAKGIIVTGLTFEVVWPAVIQAVLPAAPESPLGSQSRLDRQVAAGPLVLEVPTHTCSGVGVFNYSGDSRVISRVVTCEDGVARRSLIEFAGNYTVGFYIINNTVYRAKVYWEYRNDTHVFRSGSCETGESCIPIYPQLKPGNYTLVRIYPLTSGGSPMVANLTQEELEDDSAWYSAPLYGQVGDIEMLRFTLSGFFSAALVVLLSTAALFAMADMLSHLLGGVSILTPTLPSWLGHPRVFASISSALTAVSRAFASVASARAEQEPEPHIRSMGVSHEFHTAYTPLRRILSILSGWPIPTLLKVSSFMLRRLSTVDGDEHVVARPLIYMSYQASRLLSRITSLRPSTLLLTASLVMARAVRSLGARGEMTVPLLGEEIRAAGHGQRLNEVLAGLIELERSVERLRDSLRDMAALLSLLPSDKAGSLAEQLQGTMLSYLFDEAASNAAQALGRSLELASRIFGEVNDLKPSNPFESAVLRSIAMHLLTLQGELDDVGKFLKGLREK